jgi:hypothetical protein
VRGSLEEGERLSERYYKTVKEVREVFGADVANDLLKEGWELLKVSEVQRDEVAKLAAGAEAVARVTLVVYLMGRDGLHGAAGSQKPSDLRPCNRCGKPIKFAKNDSGKWGPVGEDGSPHRCS